MVAKCWRARISVGAIRAAWRPASIDLGHREQGDDGLAGADIALQQPQHALFAFEIGGNFGDGPGLVAGEGERQRR